MPNSTQRLFTCQFENCFCVIKTGHEVAVLMEACRHIIECHYGEILAKKHKFYSKFVTAESLNIFWTNIAKRREFIGEATDELVDEYNYKLTTWGNGVSENLGGFLYQLKSLRGKMTNEAGNEIDGFNWHKSGDLVLMLKSSLFLAVDLKALFISGIKFNSKENTAFILTTDLP